MHIESTSLLVQLQCSSFCHLALIICFNNELILAYVTDSMIKIRNFVNALDILCILNYVQIALSFDHGTFFCFSFVFGFIT